MVAQLKKEQQRELDAFNSNMKQEQSELKKQVAAQETVSPSFLFSKVLFYFRGYSWKTLPTVQ